MSAWIDVLRHACEQSSQSKVAERLNVSTAMISQVLNNAYKGNLTNIQKRVEGEFMGSVVCCPVLGDISVKDCLEHQRREYGATNSQRVRLYRACRGGCPHSQLCSGGGTCLNS